MPVFKALARDERGATAIEYALIIVCIALVIVGGLNALGPKLNNSLLSANNGFSAAAS